MSGPTFLLTQTRPTHPAHLVFYHPIHSASQSGSLRRPSHAHAASSPPRRRLYRSSLPSTPNHGGCISHPPRPLCAPPLLLPRAPPPPGSARRLGCLSTRRPVGPSRVSRGQDRVVRRVRVLAAERPVPELEQPAAQGDDPSRRL